MGRQVRISVLAVIGLLLFGVALAGNHVVTRAEGEPTASAIHVWFHEDFSTRANRWRLLDVGKAVVSYDQTTDETTLNLRADPADYALWSIPDTDLKLDRYNIEVQFKLISGDDNARVGAIVSYRSENDMLVVAVSRTGTVYLGRYYFGVWTDLIKPTKVKLDPKQPITLRAVIDDKHALKLFANDLPAGQTIIKDFKASSFGLFALSGKKGGVHAAFSRFVVSDIK
jgi:hypothetical protein